MIVILLTKSATERLSWYGLWLAQSLQKRKIPFQVFFYQDAVTIANILSYQSADTPTLREAWRALDIKLPVCVSAALQRGVTDGENAERHTLPSSNLACGFYLTGLGELAEAVLSTTKIVQL